MGLKYTKRAMTSYEVHRFFHGLEVSFFPDTIFLVFFFNLTEHPAFDKGQDKAGG